MKDKIKQAFDNVHAQEQLKEDTLHSIVAYRERHSRRSLSSMRMLPALACLVLVLLGSGFWAWFSPSATISVDINPSIELWVNRFDKVVQVVGWNDDGRELADSLDVKYMDYSRAMEAIVENENISTLLAGDGVMTVAVSGSSEAQCGRILSGVRSCTARWGNAYCYSASEEETEKAHELGLSCGKYMAYLELEQAGAQLSPDQVRDMSMREIRDMIESLTGGEALLPHGGGQGQGSGQGKGPAWARVQDD